MTNLQHVCFEGKPAPRRRVSGGSPAAVRAAHSQADHGDSFAAWVLGRCGLDPSMYRPEPLQRRLPSCLRALRVRSIEQARELLDGRGDLLKVALDALLIGVTGFFRDAGVFDAIETKVLSDLAGRRSTLRVWSAGCSTGQEIYSVAILLRRWGLLGRAEMLGTDCRSEAIEQARKSLYDTPQLRPVAPADRDACFERVDQQWRPVKALRQHVHWEVCDLTQGAHEGPWDMIMWRNSAIYLHSEPARAILLQMVGSLAPGGYLVVGRAERAPAESGLTYIERCIYRAAGHDGHRSPLKKLNRTERAIPEITA